MADNEMTTEDTEVTPVREQATLSIRETLKQQLGDQNNEEDDGSPAEDDSDSQEQENVVSYETQEVDRPLLAPPSDMNAAEKQAFLNPSPDNAHVLQQYLNRRAYETKVQYDRRMQEVNNLYRQNAAVYDVIKQYEHEYARDGISIGDIAKRSIAWDKAMQENPTQAALQWLDSYGVRLEDLMGYQQQYEPQQQNYLTREEAERIAEERYQALAQNEQQKALEYYNQRVVDSFISQKPLFRDPETGSQLEAEMAPVVQALNATGRYSSAEEVLETAYNYVVNGNPTFANLVNKMNARPVIQQQQAVVQKAKAASKSISGSVGSGTPSVVTKDIRDNLRRRLSGE